MTSGAKRWLAFGTGVGIEIGPRDLRVVCVRVRPGGARLTGEHTIERYADRPAAEWGAEYSAFIRNSGAGHIAAQVLLPRSEVVVRTLALPGVSAEDMGAAIGYQIDSLHPYAEYDAVYAWAPVESGGNVLIGISRREAVDRYATLFAEAGIKVASFTFSAAALYGAARLMDSPPEGGFLALHRLPGGDEIEAYGESPSRPVFSATFDAPTPLFEQRSTELAKSELRLPNESPPVTVADILPRPKRLPADYDLHPAALAYAAAISAACPRLSIQVNLLPQEMRAVNSRWMYVPTAALAGAAAAGAIALWVYAARQEADYRRAIQAELSKLEPQARQALTMDAAIDTARRRALMLDEFRRRTRSDLEALNELTRTLQPPTWVGSLELTRDAVKLGGETDQAAALLKTLDKTTSFRGSEFTMPITRLATGESYSIRARRINAQ